MTLSITFFDHYSNNDNIAQYTKVLKENIYTCMEWSKQSYQEIMNMPVQRLTDYLNWKHKLEEEKRKLMEEKVS